MTYVHLWHVDGEAGEVDREEILGPFEGVQLTYNDLRETENGETLAWLLPGAGWAIGKVSGGPNADRSNIYSDITFSESVPDRIA